MHIGCDTGRCSGVKFNNVPSSSKWQDSRAHMQRFGTVEVCDLNYGSGEVRYKGGSVVCNDDVEWQYVWWKCVGGYRVGVNYPMRCKDAGTPVFFAT